MRVVLATSPHLNHASFQEGVVPLGTNRTKIAQTFAPMGLMSLASAAADRAAIEIRDLNKAINSGGLPMSSGFHDAAAAWLLGGDPDLVGFMSEADSYHHLLLICAAMKRRAPSVRTLLGGPHASAVHRETLERFPEVDFVIRGEGELAFPALLGALQDDALATVGNLTYRVESSVVENDPLPLIPELDSLPWPDYSTIELEPDDDLFIEVGRGCPMQCTFCFTAPYWRRQHRIKTPGRLIAEFSELKKSHGRTDFNLTHDLFTTDRAWVLDFCRELDASGLQITWTCSSRTDRLDAELVEAMAGAGCRNIYFGVESGTAGMQERIDKNLDLDQAYEIVSHTVEAGIGATVGFISGLPGESEGSLRGTLDQCFRYLRLEDSLVHLFGYNPYRGSSVFEEIEDRLTFDPHFVDFPLGDRAHSDTCDLMRENLEVFSRYTKLPANERLDLGTLRAAEEFFPIVNAIRPLALALLDRGTDALHLLVAWASWIRERNRARGRTGSGLYRGDIRDFLEFAGTFAKESDLDDPALEEMVRWERRKNVVRAESAPVKEIGAGDENVEVLMTNRSVITDEFFYAPSFSADAVQNRATYAFYRSRNGAAAIACLGSLADCALDLAQSGLPERDLMLALSGEPDGGGSADRRLLARQVVRQLEAEDLLLRRRGRDTGTLLEAS